MDFRDVVNDQPEPSLDPQVPAVPNDVGADSNSDQESQDQAIEKVRARETERE